MLLNAQRLYLRCLRLILYFPVSSLVTLFANILQNPQEPRARSDVRLMNQVVNFLSLLAVTEEQGGIKRMLGVCVEFERIANVVLDKAEKESRSRKKRKSNKDIDESTQPLNQFSHQRNALLTPVSQTQQRPSNTFTPDFTGDLNQQPFNQNLNGQFADFGNGDIALPLDFSGILNTPSSIPPALAGTDFQQVAPDGVSPLNMGSFQQPFVPQDLWQMPQTLEWDWADVGNTGYPAFDGLTGENPSPSDGPSRR